MRNIMQENIEQPLGKLTIDGRKQYFKSHWNIRELLNCVHEVPSGHQAICIEILE
jgi:hypothetical protein